MPGFLDRFLDDLKRSIAHIVLLAVGPGHSDATHGASEIAAVCQMEDDSTGEVEVLEPKDLVVKRVGKTVGARGAQIESFFDGKKRRIPKTAHPWNIVAEGGASKRSLW